MATTFVSQTVGEVGTSDMWWQPWMVIRIQEDVTADAMIKALGEVDATNFVDDYENFSWADVTREVTAAIQQAGWTLVAVEQADAVHLPS